MTCILNSFNRPGTGDVLEPQLLGPKPVRGRRLRNSESMPSLSSTAPEPAPAIKKETIILSPLDEAQKRRDEMLMILRGPPRAIHGRQFRSAQNMAEEKLMPPIMIPDPGAGRRLPMDITKATYMSPGICMIPPVEVPKIASSDPKNDRRLSKLNRDIADMERKLARIPTTRPKPVTCADMYADAESTSVDEPPNSMCAQFRRWEVPRMDGDGLFTSESRGNFWWKAKKRGRKDKKHTRPYDAQYTGREQRCKVVGCLRVPCQQF